MSNIFAAFLIIILTEKICCFNNDFVPDIKFVCFFRIKRKEIGRYPAFPADKIKRQINSLNFTEYEILKLLAERKKIFEIAAILKISERKVYQYKSSMMSKLNLTSGLELLKIFLNNE